MTYPKTNSTGYLHHIPTEKIKTCLLTTCELSKPTDELIATCEAMFTLIRNSEMELETINVFHRLEMQFEFYRQLNWYRQFYRTLPIVGVLLCADKNDAMVKITLPENNKSIVASKYQLYLPSEQQLLDELKNELGKL